MSFTDLLGITDRTFWTVVVIICVLTLFFLSMTKTKR